MKEATGEVSMTMVTIVAIAVIGSIVAILWPSITNWIQNSFGSAGANTCPQGTTWNEAAGACQ